MAGNAAFENYYQNIYGPRWAVLRSALLAPGDTIPYGQHLSRAYRLDAASVLAAETLRLPEAGTILDACAAPGGKTLVLASRMGGETLLLANELSSERRRRLSKVLDEYAPPELRARITVSGFDAAALASRASERERFSGILLDAPCSSERHVMQNEKLLAAWTQARPRFLARRQWALLSAAFLLLKPRSSLVYATCAITPEENDAVAARLLDKYKNRVELDPPDFTLGEATRCGRIILPDAASNAGPLYVARFWKCS